MASEKQGQEQAQRRRMAKMYFGQLVELARSSRGPDPRAMTPEMEQVAERIYELHHAYALNL